MTEFNSFTRKMIFIGIAALFGSMSMIVRAGTPTATSQSIIDVDQLDDGTQILRFRAANFSTLNRTIKYNSTTMNDPKGMLPLYKISNQILDVFLGEDAIPEGLCNTQSSTHTTRLNWWMLPSFTVFSSEMVSAWVARRSRTESERRIPTMEMQFALNDYIIFDCFHAYDFLVTHFHWPACPQAGERSDGFCLPVAERFYESPHLTARTRENGEMNWLPLWL